MRHVNLNNADYLGIDIVEFIINDNNTLYKSNNISFLNLDISDRENKISADLCIIKDVFQHLDYSSIYKIINKFDWFKYVLITNDSTDINLECKNGGYRPIRIDTNPFYINAKKVFTFKSCNFIKDVYLYTSI